MKMLTNRRLFVPSVRMLLAASLLLGTVTALPALAQDSTRAAGGKKKGDKSRTLTFEDDMIETQLLRPDTEAIQGLSNRTRTSLIRIRKDFFAEIIRSAEDI